MEITPDSIHHQSLYKLMIGSIVPRPIGWISSIDEAGQNNLAPFSFFNAVCGNPPTLLFCPGTRGIDGQHKDTLNNVRTNGEFVVNIVTESLAEAMNLTSGEYPSDVDEFGLAGVTPVPSLKVRPMRVAESPIHYECVVSQIVTIGDAPGGGSIVIGRIVHLHIADDLLIGEDKIDIERLQPIGRLAGTAYSHVNDIFHMTRPIANLSGASKG